MVRKGLSVLYISPFRQSISGSDESLLDLIASLRAAGIESVVALPKGGPYSGRYVELGATIVYLPIVSIRRTLRPDRWLTFSIGLAQGFYGIKSLLKGHGINIVHTNMETAPAGAMAARAAAIPSVIHIRSTSISRPRWAFQGLIRFLRNHADKAIAISDAVHQLMVEGGFPENRIERIYDPVDTGRFRPRSQREIADLAIAKLGPLGIPTGCPLIGLIGRMNPIKGQYVFLEAAAKITSSHPDTHFLLIGDAADERERLYEAGLKKQAIVLGMADKTHFLGHRSDVHELMPLLRASVSPSTTEAFGRPAAEAMACGVPAIVAATDGLKEIVADGETGYVVPAGNVKALADAMDDVLSNPSRSEEMGRKGRERVLANFSSEIHAEKIRSLYRSLT